ncbi:hypothetical protein CYMTET_21488 [Cymbomonas tetramitiformis]|uniref:Uncharacterized protein n=1 Tax=Cymbomonas tetramitiformis TaxID=36881 RepID=A0AAE0G235_9CHLO|nr:hypothetical protein CYMTET_21488 [Cymbomonas tetramitiformis]
MSKKGVPRARSACKTRNNALQTTFSLANRTPGSASKGVYASLEHIIHGFVGMKQSAKDPAGTAYTAEVMRRGAAKYGVEQYKSILRSSRHAPEASSPRKWKLSVASGNHSEFLSVVAAMTADE